MINESEHYHPPLSMLYKQRIPNQDPRLNSRGGTIFMYTTPKPENDCDLAIGPSRTPKRPELPLIQHQYTNGVNYTPMHNGTPQQ